MDKARDARRDVVISALRADRGGLGWDVEPLTERVCGRPAC